MSGVRAKNPVFVMMVGLCPVAAVTDKVSTALAMAACALLVFLTTSLSVSALRTFIPGKYRRGAVLIVSGFWVAVLDWVLSMLLPQARAPLGIYLPLLAVSCLVVTNGSRYPVADPAAPALSRGFALGARFALALLLMAAVREPLGYGTVTLIPLGRFAGTLRIAFLEGRPLRILAAPAGALLVLGYWAALFALLPRKTEEGEGEQ
jgi:Na+-translocating ferredoxin:NAD+ oxidoreductase subunit E